MYKTFIHRALVFFPDSNKYVYFQNSSCRQFTTYCLLPERPIFGLKRPENKEMEWNAMLYINFRIFRHGNVIYSNYLYVWVSMHNSGKKCLLPDRPDFGLNIKFDPITCYILFHRFLDMLISILAAIFAFGPP